ncbi:hypothetical protein J1P26_22555 [Neobacillus sp. MM2021_6]|uniref:hypothetical protein n=1 Tax=Bacillaceae TaxID=186817 RepID=UPI00140C9FD3|nr:MULTISPECIES: hypothetical protein [Bacillaceae]MBO0962479.1 hypothetical protein [Neobacillus sp. MM2021_6]NHC18994.1 hypothetical protein [Bacillus sp. MM2020_4]
MEPNQIASFVVRVQLAAVEKETGRKQWRIKVTHVQKQQETLFGSMAEAMVYMEEMAEEA